MSTDNPAQPTPALDAAIADIQAAMRRFANAHTMLGNRADRSDADEALCAAINAYKRAAVDTAREKWKQSAPQPAPAQPALPQVQPLTDERIVMDGLMMVHNSTTSLADWFIAGVKFAERAHGIGVRARYEGAQGVGKCGANAGAKRAPDLK